MKWAVSLSVPFAIIICLFVLASVLPPNAVYTAHLPLVVAQSAPFKGLALSANGNPGDVGLLHAAWYYTWAQTYEFQAQAAGEFIPMTLDAALSIPCPPVLMALNEPDIGGISVASGSGTLWALVQACPQTYIVFGNVSQYGLGWLSDALADYQSKHGPYLGAVGIHWYGWQTVDGLAEFLAEAWAVHPRLWLTEFAVFHSYDTPEEVAEAVTIAQQYTERYAWFTNRVTTGDPWANREFYLVYPDGSLTPSGQAVQEWR